MRSNTYTLIFTSFITLILGFLLSFTYTQLKSMQEENLAVDIRKNILRALDIREEKNEEWSNEKVQDLFNKYIKAEVVSKNGLILNNINIENIDAEYDSINFPIYYKLNDNQIDGYAIPVIGRGLWSTLYGYLALEPDASTVKGIQFYSHKETPGLGAEIEKDWFTNNFIGKKIVNSNGELVSIEVLRGKVDELSNEAYHQVDGISGATMTTKGVTQFLLEDLQKYEPFFKKIRTEVKEITWLY